jgi:hypothetical protein
MCSNNKTPWEEAYLNCLGQLAKGFQRKEKNQGSGLAPHSSPLSPHSAHAGAAHSNVSGCLLSG